MEQIYTPKQDYKVLCYCITFNQAIYIEDTLNGFAMQNTDFPFACLVVEDCSTDGEQEVIKAWLERECDMSKAEYIDLELSNVILVPHKTNVNCTFAIYLLKRNLWREPELKETMVSPWRERCEYEAICEGDDYWIAVDKLQSQFDFMECNKQCMMCFHNANHCNEMTGVKEPFNKIKIKSTLTTRDLLLNKWITPTASFFCRITNIPKVDGINGDMNLLFYLSFKGYIHYDERIMSSYRYMTEGSLSSQFSKAIIYQKKINLYKWVNKETSFRYFYITLPKMLIMSLLKIIRK